MARKTKMARKTYKDYPENYFKILENFYVESEDVVVEDTYAALVYARHDLHRFFKALSVAAEEDSYAAKLSTITRDIVLIIEPPHAARESPAKLYVKMNPMAKMLIKSRPPRSASE